MTFEIAGAQVIAFVVFIVLIGPALIAAGMGIQRLRRIESWITEHVELHKELGAILTSVEISVARSEARVDPENR